jgi:hypothetical protein
MIIKVKEKIVHPKTPGGISEVVEAGETIIVVSVKHLDKNRIKYEIVPEKQKSGK